MKDKTPEEIDALCADLHRSFLKAISEKIVYKEDMNGDLFVLGLALGATVAAISKAFQLNEKGLDKFSESINKIAKDIFNNENIVMKDISSNETIN